MKYKLLHLLLILCLLCGCAENSPADSASNVTPQQTHPGNSENLTDLQVYEMFFDIENTVHLDLDMSEAELTKMQQDYDTYDRNGGKSPVYRKGDLHVTITTPDDTAYAFTINEVGVRMKGNTSRTDFYDPQQGIYNLIHLKISFQETFDDEQYYGSEAKKWTEAERNARKNRTFATLEKIDLRWNRCDDSTYIREYFAYQTYRENGVLAPNTNLASFDWAGNHMGVYTINEPIDEIFLARNLPASALGGDLYKCGWAGSNNASLRDTNSIGIENDGAGEFYAYDLKTNKKTSDHATLKNLIHKLNRADCTKKSLAELIDMDNFLSFSAVSYLLGNPDDLRSNYNNCYIYFRADNGKALFIPYDYDRCMGITVHWNPTGNAVTADSPFSVELNSGNGAQRNPLILYTIAEGGYYLEEYASKLTKITNSSWFQLANFESIYNIASGNYRHLTTPSKPFYNAEGLQLFFDIQRTSAFSDNRNISVRDYLNAKLATLNFYMERLEHYIGSVPSIPTQWYIRSDVTDWQNNPAYAMTEENGIITIHFTAAKEMRLKVYDDHTGRWYGSECISTDCTVPFETDNHTNIVLPAGSYTLTFYPDAEIIHLVKH